MSFEDNRIALTDHNLLLDGVHIHDRPANVVFELAQASWAFGESSRLLTLRYEDTNEEYIFAFGPTDLPDLTTEAGMAELSYQFKETRADP